MNDERHNSKLGHKISYKSYFDKPRANPKISYSYLKPRTNPMIETILNIEDLLMTTELNWTISYEPTTKSYSIFIANLSEEDDCKNQNKPDTTSEPVFDTEIIFDTLEEGRDLCDYLLDKCEVYGVVTVLDLYNYMERSFPDPASSKYGWLAKDIDNIDIEKLPFGGFVLKIAKPKRIV